MKFATKLTILFSAIFLFTGVVVSYSIYTSNIKSLEAQITAKLEDKAFHIMDKLDRMLFEKGANIKMLISTPVIKSKNSTPKQITERLKVFEKNYKVYAYMSLFDLNRIRIADTSGRDIGKQHPFTEYWPEIAEGNDFVMDVYMSGALKEPVFYFAAVVKDEKGFPFRVLVTRIPIEKLYEIIKQTAGTHEFESEKEIKTDLVNKNGVLIYSNYNKKGILKEAVPDWENIKKFIATEGKLGSQRHYHLEEEAIYSFAREHGYLDFKGNDWTLIMCIPAKVAFAPAVDLRNRVIIILLFSGVSALLVIFIFSRTISKPIIRLRNAANEIGRGNLDAKVEISSKDEIGQLSESFNKMTSNLKKHIQQNELILNSAGEGILGLDLNGNHTFINPAAANMLGYKVRELLGKHSHSIWHHTKEDGSPYPEEECPIYDAFRKGVVNQRVRDEVFWRKNGTSFPVAYTSTPIMEDGRITGAVVTFTDITERKRLEETLKKEQQELKLIIDSSPIIVFYKDKEGKFIRINKAFAEALRMPEEEFVGKTVFDLYSAKIAQGMTNDDQEVLKSGRPKLNIIEQYESASGLRWVQTDKIPICDENGIAVGLIGFAQDITERKKAEEALHKSEEKYRTLFEESKDAVYVSTPEGRFLDINPAGVELFGYPSKDEILKVDIARGIYLNPEDRKKFIQILQQQGFVKDFEIQAKRKDGEILDLLLSSTPVYNKEGAMVAYRGIIRDITQHKKLEAQFRQAQKMEAIGRLTGGIAHDFNNILQAIMSIGGLLQFKTKEDDPLRECVNDLFAVAERAASLTKSLLAFSRKQIISLMPINLNDIIKNAEKILSRVMGEDIELKTNLSDKDLVIMADSGQIEQVLMNLVTNARDAMPEGGQLIIETDTVEMDDEYIKTHGYGKAGKYALMTVTDTGIGMDEETKKKLFEPFFTTKEVGKGTGLGLSTVYGIVKQHNGYINVYSEVGGGTAFKIYLPIIKPDILEKTEFAKEGMVYTGGTETILIAEDDEPVRKLTKETLERAGYKVIDAVDGDDAMEKFMEHKDEIQLLLLDVIMPKRNGREVYDEIRKIRPEVRVIFVSGYPADFIATKGIIEEGLNYIAKPLPPNQLLKKIREALT
jgi:PAS domain S-box-containing protein